ncbi:Hpt domain-containing protein [Oharaeibacter diazotrophicus]|uniref:Hpt protein n=1 Tax=Oharaeibacter diazotrophicus TaxID=1920512 RepID=A0A4R6RAD2_9HYPH|nr:Hpt domain-containing protein [Oharaeibacter diazotrophicus]TDP82597.1 Hpt protein [Oharaeibacter diazotrophicus]BBE72639.1 Hpt domain protein [Pleomorphomonas sp. SM30]GLS76673.1 histidine kinase [Oharaeibacter diazotrophicus]
MAQSAEAYEIVEAKNDLRKKVREVRGGRGEDPVARAEAALKILSSHFEDWAADEIREIETTHAAWVKAGYADGPKRDGFFRAAHDLKGQATTLGFPLATRVAGSLCALLEGLPGPDKLPRALIEQHVQALRAIHRERARDENDRVGAALADTLREVSTRYLADNGALGDETPFDE